MLAINYHTKLTGAHSSLLITNNYRCMWWWILTCLLVFQLRGKLQFLSSNVWTLGVLPTCWTQLCWYLGLINYEIPTALICRRNVNVAPIGICYHEVFMPYSLDSYAGYAIPLLKDSGYHTYIYIATYLRHLTGSLRIHNSCTLPVLWSGASTS